MNPGSINFRISTSRQFSWDPRSFFSNRRNTETNDTIHESRTNPIFITYRTIKEVKKNISSIEHELHEKKEARKNKSKTAPQWDLDPPRASNVSNIKSRIYNYHRPKLKCSTQGRGLEGFAPFHLHVQVQGKEKDTRREGRWLAKERRNERGKSVARRRASKWQVSAPCRLRPYKSSPYLVALRDTIIYRVGYLI